MKEDLIKLLPDAIANQIAAGEVIQRPASAVKELLENALDANGDSIQLIFKDGGKTLIQVIDNGKGMSPTDARLCFSRHATSKITNADDLFSIQTMGFRGEALASIAAIAHVELKTRRAEDKLGTLIIMEGSEVKSQESCACQPGTSLSIKNLFFNVPARRKFLKSNPIEARHIREEFHRIALAYPEIAFSVINDGHEIYHLKSGNVHQRIVGIMRKNYSERLVPIEQNTDYLKIKGYIGKPQFAKKTRGEQFLFVNKRFIKSQAVHKAVLEAYATLLAKEQIPLYTIYIEIDPSRIDVNVHPTKQEIKFEDEQIITTFVGAAVRKALSSHHITPAIDFDQKVNLGFEKTKPFNPTPKTQNEFNPSNKGNDGYSQGTSYISRKSSGSVGWEELHKTGPLEVKQDRQQEEQLFTTYQSSFNAEPKEESTNIPPVHLNTSTDYQPFQIHNRYIICHIKSGIIILDQQASHERILYEKYLNQLEKNSGDAQKMMFPQKVNLSAEDAHLLSQLLPEITALGYLIEEAEEADTFVISGTPSELGNLGDIEEIFDDLLAQYKKNIEVLQLEKRKGLAQAMARQSAIKRGRSLTTTEMQNLLDQLFACQIPYIAPNGRKTFVRQQLNQWDKLFEKK